MGASETPAAASSLRSGEPRRELRRASVATALAAVAASSRGSSCGSAGPPVERRTAGRTARDSPSRSRPRSSGTRCKLSRAGIRGFSPDVTLTPPPGLRTAAARTARSATERRSGEPCRRVAPCLSLRVGGGGRGGRLHHLADASHSLTDAGLVLNQREADEAVAGAAETDPGTYRHLGLREQQLAELE